MKQTCNSWVLGYSRDINYEKERQRRVKRKPNGVELNTMYKCNECGKVWELHVRYNERKFIFYTDIPSYGLERNKCKQCKGECNG